MSWDISEGPRSARDVERTAVVWEWELHHRYQPEQAIVRVVVDPSVAAASEASPEARLAALSRGRTALDKFRRLRRMPPTIRVGVDGVTGEHPPRRRHRVG